MHVFCIHQQVYRIFVFVFHKLTAPILSLVENTRLIEKHKHQNVHVDINIGSDIRPIFCKAKNSDNYLYSYPDASSEHVVGMKMYRAKLSHCIEFKNHLQRLAFSRFVAPPYPATSCKKKAA